jgi:hypothetical protein
MTTNNKLQFGCFNVKVRKDNGTTENVLCKPLTQAEYADGWQHVLPRRTKKSNIYNWNVTLAQLPPHLWSRCHTNADEDGKLFNNTISDGIYRYNVSTTDYDNEMRCLYNQLGKLNPDLSQVQYLLNELQDNVSGWLLLRAKQLV